MSVVSVKARSFILALFIRDDGERFLLGDNGYDFIDSQLHFVANTIENDEVEKQGADGVMLAGQVRRASVQTFDGYVGDATTPKDKVEEMRREFIAFFAKDHHFRVIYVDCNRNAWQRKGGYLVDAPEVKELWQIHPEYHVGLNFEDVNYYEYDENAEGQEILANIMKVPISSDVEGGLVWDEDGAVSEDATVVYDGDTATASGTSITVSDAVEAPLSDFKLKGETSQNGTPTPSAPVAVQTVTGENVVKICGKNLYDFRDVTYKAGTFTADDDGWLTCTLNTAPSGNSDQAYYTHNLPLKNSTQYAVVLEVKSVSGSGSLAVFSRWTGNQEGQFTAEQVVNFSNLQAGKTYVYKPTTYASFNYDVGLRTYVRFAAGQTGSITFRLSVLADTNITADTFSYEPYQEQNYTIGLFGSKNIFDKDNANIWNGYMGDASLAAAANARSLYIPVAAGQTYTFTRPNTTSQVNDFGYCFITDVPINGKAYLDGRHIISSALTFTATAPAGAKYMLIYFAWNPSAEQLATILSGYQIEYGSTSSPYEAFQSLELCKIPGTDYQDKFIPRDGKWYLHKEVGIATFNVRISSLSGTGSGSDIASSDGAFFISAGDWNGAGGDYAATIGNALLISPNIAKFEAQTLAGNAAANAMIDGTMCHRSGTNDRLYFRHSAYVGKTGEEIRAILASQGGASFYYHLATPTDTEITNEALVGQLEAILSQGKTYAGTNNITTVIAAGNEQGELEITYYTRYDAKVVGGGYVWEAGGSGGPTIVTNESISAVSPVWTVFGPALNPQLENVTTGEQIQYVGMIGEGQTLVIDMGQQTALLDGLNVVANIVGDYLSLAPGSNTLLFSADSDAPESEIGWSEIVG